MLLASQLIFVFNAFLGIRMKHLSVEFEFQRQIMTFGIIEVYLFSLEHNVSIALIFAYKIL